MQENEIRPRVKKISLQQADIIKTHGDNRKIINITKQNWNFQKQTKLKC